MWGSPRKPKAAQVRPSSSVSDGGYTSIDLNSIANGDVREILSALCPGGQTLTAQQLQQAKMLAAAARSGGILISQLPETIQGEAKVLDLDGSNVLDSHEVSEAVRALIKARRERRILMRVVLGLAVFSLFFLGSIVGLVWAVFTLAQDTKVDSGVMVDKDSGAPVQVSSTETTTTASGALVSRTTGGPVKVSASLTEATLSSTIPDEILMEMRFLKLSGATGVMNVAVNAATRVQTERSRHGSIVVLHTALGSIRLDGTALSPDATAAEALQSIGFFAPRSGRRGRALKQIGLVAGLFNYVLEDQLASMFAGNSTADDRPDVPVPEFPEEYTANATIYHPCDGIDKEGNPINKCRSCTPVFDPDVAPNGTFVEHCVESPVVVTFRGKQYVPVREWTVSLDERAYTHRTIPAAVNQTEHEIWDYENATQYRWQSVDVDVGFPRYLHCGSNPALPLHLMGVAYNASWTVEEVSAGANGGTEWRMRGHLTIREDVVEALSGQVDTNGAPMSLVPEINVDVVVDDEGMVTEMYNDITNTITVFDNIATIPEHQVEALKQQYLTHYPTDPATQCGGRDAPQPPLPTGLARSETASPEDIPVPYEEVVPRIRSVYGVLNQPLLSFSPEFALYQAIQLRIQYTNTTDGDATGRRALVDALVETEAFQTRMRRRLTVGEEVRAAVDEYVAAEDLTSAVRAYRRVMASLDGEYEVTFGEDDGPAGQPGATRRALEFLDTVPEEELSHIEAALRGGRRHRALEELAGEDGALVAEGATLLVGKPGEAPQRRVLQCGFPIEVDWKVFTLSFLEDRCYDGWIGSIGYTFSVSSDIVPKLPVCAITGSLTVFITAPDSPDGTTIGAAGDINLSCGPAAILRKAGAKGVWLEVVDELVRFEAGITAKLAMGSSVAIWNPLDFGVSLAPFVLEQQLEMQAYLNVNFGLPRVTSQMTAFVEWWAPIAGYGREEYVVPMGSVIDDSRQFAYFTVAGFNAYSCKDTQWPSLPF
ncbi:unnamed protein product [Pedinophyceae sp. YPF-701]|nr:unnamed protein product [Pedinophyceae sp. YPF-701]